MNTHYMQSLKIFAAFYQAKKCISYYGEFLIIYAMYIIGLYFIEKMSFVEIPLIPLELLIIAGCATYAIGAIWGWNKKTLIPVVKKEQEDLYYQDIAFLCNALEDIEIYRKHLKDFYRDNYISKLDHTQKDSEEHALIILEMCEFLNHGYFYEEESNSLFYAVKEEIPPQYVRTLTCISRDDLHEMCIHIDDHIDDSIDAIKRNINNHIEAIERTLSDLQKIYNSP